MPIRSLPRWLPPVAFVAALGIALFFSNGTVKTPTGEVAITDAVGQAEADREAQALSRDRLVRYDQGLPLTADDIEKLRKASRIYDRMAYFEPMNSGLFYISGKLHMILNEHEVAISRFRQCIFNVEPNIRNTPALAGPIRETAANAGYLLSLLLLTRANKQAAFEAADFAVKTVPTSSDYLTARGSALNELRRKPEAIEDLKKAIGLDPRNSRAKTLLRFIGK